MVIESPFVLTVENIDYPLDPDDRGGLGILLRVYPDSLRSGRVDRDGTLRLEFASGTSIAVPSGPAVRSVEHRRAGQCARGLHARNRRRDCGLELANPVESLQLRVPHAPPYDRVSGS